MQTSTNEVVILWASYFDELAAISFSYEFRQMGMPVTLVAVHQNDEQRCSDVLTHSRQGLQEAVAMAQQIICLVIPTSVEILGQFEQDPLLWRLVSAVYENGGRVVMARSRGVADPEIVDKLPPPDRLIYYPAVEKLLLFARWLSYSLVVGDQLDAGRGKGIGPGKGVVPRLVKVAASSDPGRVAGSMAKIIREFGYAEAQAVGAAAINQMLKATAVARSYLASNRLALFVVPDFSTVQIAGTSRSAIRLFISAWPVGMDNWIDWEQSGSLVDADGEESVE